MSAFKTNNKRIAKNTLFLYIRMMIILAVNLYTSRIVRINPKILKLLYRKRRLSNFTKRI